MKLWDKGFSTDKKIDIFTVGNDRELDLLLAKYDVAGSLAHAKMLHKIGLLSKDEIDAVEKELESILEQINKGEFTIEDSFEDVHSKVEFLLTQKLGDTGKKIILDTLTDGAFFWESGNASLTILSGNLQADIGGTVATIAVANPAALENGAYLVYEAGILYAEANGVRGIGVASAAPIFGATVNG